MCLIIRSSLCHFVHYCILLSAKWHVTIPAERRDDVKKLQRDLPILLLGALIQAVGICNIHARSSITEGGVLGMTLLLYHWTHLSPAFSSILLNAFCYLYGISRLGKPFLIRSVIASGAYAVFYLLLDPYAPLFPSLLLSPFLSAVTGALFIGVGAGLCVLAGGATSGDDAIAMGLSERLKCDIRIIYLVSDMTVLILSLSYIPFSRIVWSMLTVLLSGEIIGVMQRIRRPS